MGFGEVHHGTRDASHVDVYRHRERLLRLLAQAVDSPITMRWCE